MWRKIALHMLGHFPSIFRNYPCSYGPFSVNFCTLFSRLVWLSSNSKNCSVFGCDEFVYIYICGNLPLFRLWVDVVEIVKDQLFTLLPYVYFVYLCVYLCRAITSHFTVFLLRHAMLASGARYCVQSAGQFSKINYAAETFTNTVVEFTWKKATPICTNSSLPHVAAVMPLHLLSLICAHGRAFSVAKLCYWSVMSVSQDVALSSSQWRASSHQCSLPVVVAWSGSALQWALKRAATCSNAKCRDGLFVSQCSTVVLLTRAMSEIHGKCHFSRSSSLRPIFQKNLHSWLRRRPRKHANICVSRLKGVCLCMHEVVIVRCVFLGLFFSF